MSFSQEDKKKVRTFFENLLLHHYKEPVYYEYLRGHISKDDAVCRYVKKNCKGEDLLTYFKKRKNYFVVDFRGDVSLTKSRFKFLSEKVSKTREIYESDNDEENNSEYSCPSNHSRSNSVTSSYRTPLSSFGGEDLYERDPETQKRIESEGVSIKYFTDLLRSKEKLSLKTLKIKNLPSEVEHYMTKYMKKKIVSFFENNSEIFHIDKDNYVSLKTLYEEIQQEEIPASEMDELFVVEETEAIANFFQCAEFFVTILKKKSIPLKNLSGFLSKAPPDVLDYLKRNYDPFKNFLLEADKLFIINENEDVSLTKDYSKLLKYGKKHFHSILNGEFSGNNRYSHIKSLFQSKNALKSTSEADEAENYLNGQELGMSDINFSSEDVFYTSDDTVSDCAKPGSSSNESFQNEPSPEREENIDCDKSGNKIQGNSEPTQLDFKSQSIPLNAYEDERENILNNETEKNISVTEGFSKMSFSATISDKVKRDTQRSLIECAFIAQLLCLEVVEKNYNMCLKYEYKAVKFFIDILEGLPGRKSEFNSLKGSVGQASIDVKFFMKQLYKGEKIKHFFEKHDEFVLSSSSSWIKLSSSYKDCLEKKRKLCEAVINEEKIYTVYRLYDSHFYDVFTDVFDCLSKICNFLQNKSRTKFSRLNGIFSKFSTSQQDFINSLSGSSVSDKFENFIWHFTVFDIVDEYISISPELDVLLLVKNITNFNEKLNMLKQQDKPKLPAFENLLSFPYVYEDEIDLMDEDNVRNSITESVEGFLSHFEHLDYSEMPKVVGHEILLHLLSKNEDSQSLIKLLEESNLFELKNGQVLPKKEIKNTELDNLQQSDVKLIDNVSATSNDNLKNECPKVSSLNEHTVEEKDIEKDNVNSKCKSVNHVTSSIPNDSDELNNVCNKLQTSNKDDKKTVTLEESVVSFSEVNTSISCDMKLDELKAESLLNFDNSNENIDFCHIESNEKDSKTEQEILNADETDNSKRNVLIESGDQLSESVLCSKSMNKIGSDLELKELLLEESGDELHKTESVSSSKYLDSFTSERAKALLEKWLDNETLCSLPTRELKEEGSEILHAESVPSMESSETVRNKVNILIHKTSEPDGLKIPKCKSEGHLGKNKISSVDDERNTLSTLSKSKQSLFSSQAAELERKGDETGNKENKIIEVTKLNDPKSTSFVKRNKENIDNSKAMENVYQLPTFQHGMHSDVSSVNESLNQSNKSSGFEVDNEDESCNQEIIFKKASLSVSNVPIDDMHKRSNKDQSFKQLNDNNLNILLSSAKNKYTPTDDMQKHHDKEHFSSHSKEKKHNAKNLGSTKQLKNENLYVSPQSDSSENMTLSSTDVTKHKNSHNGKYSEISIKPAISSKIGEFDNCKKHSNKILNSESAPADPINSKSTQLRHENEFCTEKRNNPVSSSHEEIISESLKQNDFNEESHSSNLMHQIDGVPVLQPFQAKIILISLDSCIVETLIKGRKRYIFCLKSSFHCEQHADCSECFDSLIVGDTVSCYIPPGKSFDYGNMCFAFMFCKESETSGGKPEYPFVSLTKKSTEHFMSKTLVKKDLLNQDSLHTSENCKSLGKPAYSPDCECHTPVKKSCSDVGEQRCQVNCLTVSQHTQTVQSVERKCCGIEKGCQIQCSTVSEDTQTYHESFESECQTVVTGDIKSCPPVVEKACLVNFPTVSQSVQTINESTERTCQTSVSGSIKSCVDTASSECQTLLSGPVKKTVQLVDKSCEALPVIDIVDEMTQTMPHDCIKEREAVEQVINSLSSQVDDLLSKLESLTSHANETAQGNSLSVVEHVKETCDTACQTISTGAIMIRKYISTC